MAINFFSEDVEMPVFTQKTVEDWVVGVIREYRNEAGEVNVIFCSDDYLLDINQRFLSHDYYTDVITFNYCDDKIISGDVFVSIDRVFDNAKKFQTESSELFRVIIHGILHLLGFNDSSDDEKKAMRIKESRALSLLAY